jgi:hypothetical protein
MKSKDEKPDVRWKQRDRASHTYHAETAREIVRAVTDAYCALFDAFEAKMLNLAESGG